MTPEEERAACAKIASDLAAFIRAGSMGQNVDAAEACEAIASAIMARLTIDGTDGLANLPDEMKCIDGPLRFVMPGNPEPAWPDDIPASFRALLEEARRRRSDLT